MDFKFELVYIDGETKYFDSITEAKASALRTYFSEMELYLKENNLESLNSDLIIRDVADLTDNGYIEYFCRIDKCYDKYMWEGEI